MSDLTVIRPVEVIAAEINAIQNHARVVVVTSAIAVGKLLVEAKEQVSHGEWGKWLEEKVDYSQSRANDLMRMYREYGDKIHEIPTLGNLSYTKAVALLGVPAEEREQFLEEHDVESMSAREMQQAVKDKQEAEKRAAEAEKAAEKERKAREKLEKESKSQAAKVADLLKQLEAAKSSGDEEAIQSVRMELEASKTELAQAIARQKELEQQLRDKPIETSAVIEKIPDEVAAELADLREKAAKMGASEKEMKFRVNFDALVNGFAHLLAALNEIPEDERPRYKKAVNGLIGKMQENLK